MATFGLGFAGAVLVTPLVVTLVPAGAASGPSKSVTVKILASGLQPAVVNIVPGATVIWVNEAGATRSILASDASFDSGSLANGERFQFAFTQSRTVTYSVVQSPGISGTVVVAAPGAPAPAPVAAAGPVTSPFAPATPAANPADAQPAGFAYTGSATAINGLVGGLVLAFGAGLVMTARRYGVVATLSRLSFSYGPDDLLPSRRHRRVLKDGARRGRTRRSPDASDPECGADDAPAPRAGVPRRGRARRRSDGPIGPRRRRSSRRTPGGARRERLPSRR